MSVKYMVIKCGRRWCESLSVCEPESVWLKVREVSRVQTVSKLGDVSAGCL